MFVDIYGNTESAEVDGTNKKKTFQTTTGKLLTKFIAFHLLYIARTQIYLLFNLMCNRALGRKTAAKKSHADFLVDFIITIAKNKAKKKQQKKWTY